MSYKHDRLSEALDKINRHVIDVSSLKTISSAAEAYLAEHPADENEPITGDWLVSGGCEECTDCSGHWYSDCTSDRGHSIYVDWHVSGVAEVDSTLEVTCLTRGHWRRLCKALGVEWTV